MKLLIFILAFNVSEPRDQVERFYSWYLESIRTQTIYNLVKPANANGRTYLQYQPYLDSLKKLEVFHSDFFDSELQTFERCDSFLQQWTWDDYQTDEPNYDGYCDFLDYYRWFRTQEPVTDIEILDQKVNGKTAVVKLKAVYRQGNEVIVMNPNIIAELKLTGGTWLITGIVI